MVGHVLWVEAYHVSLVHELGTLAVQAGRVEGLQDGAETLRVATGGQQVQQRAAMAAHALLQ